MPKSELKICSKPGCQLFAAPEKKYCFSHSQSENTFKETEIDKYNIHGFKNQVELFRYIWDTRPRKCFVTGEDLEKYYGTKFFHSLFMHVMSKAKNRYPEFKLYVNNIILSIPLVHKLFDVGSLEEIIRFEKENKCDFSILFDVEEILFNEYKTEFKNKDRVLRKIVSLYRKTKTT